MYRHSILNYRHFDYLHKVGAAADMSEKRGCKKSCRQSAVEMVLKAGEVMYLPSHWFHYIASLQRSSAMYGIDPSWTSSKTPEFMTKRSPGVLRLKVYEKCTIRDKARCQPAIQSVAKADVHTV
jgi:hypothetical protein